MIKVILYFRKQIFLAIVFLTITFIVSCARLETWKPVAITSASHSALIQPISQLSKDTDQNSKGLKDPPSSASSQAVEPGVQKTTIPVPSSILGENYDPTLDLYAGPVPLPLRIQIPILDVDAPILAVGLTKDNNMDAPKGPYGDPNWSSTFWYRGSAIPGEAGTTTIAGHVNGLLGQPETFAKIRKLKPGDLIIIKNDISEEAVYYVVDEVKKYSMAELSELEISERIFGGRSGSDGQKLTDGTSHLTLITCTGNYINGEFDHRIVVFSTLR